MLHLNGFYFGPWRLPQPGTGLTLLGFPFPFTVIVSSTGLCRALLRAFMLPSPHLLPPLNSFPYTSTHMNSIFLVCIFLNICLFALCRERLWLWLELELKLDLEYELFFLGLLNECFWRWLLCGAEELYGWFRYGKLPHLCSRQIWVNMSWQ